MRDVHLGLSQGVPLLGVPRLNAETFTFIVLALGAVLSGALALLSREIVHTVIFIGGLFADLGAIYFVLSSPFLGLLQLAVYAGAVTILLMFAVMVIKRRIFARESTLGIQVPTLALAVLVGAVLVNVAMDVPNYGPAPSCPAADPYCVGALAQNLFLLNGAWLVLLGFIMLSALVGAVHLAREWRTPSVRRIRED